MSLPPPFDRGPLGDISFESWPRWPLTGSDRTCGSDAGEFDAAQVLWTDTELFNAPRANAARVLVAIERALTLLRPLAGREREFLDLVGGLSAIDSRAFTAVWGDPRAYQWTRVAHDLMGELLATSGRSVATTEYCEALHLETPLDALAWHLEQFKAIALGMALCSGTDLVFETPYRPLLPFAIPGTRWSLDGSEPVVIMGVVDGQVHASSPDVRECPVVRHATFELPLEASAFHVPGWEMAKPVLQAGPVYQSQHVDLVRQALAAMQRYAPEIFAQFERGIRVGAVKPSMSGSYDDFSNPELPGSFIASVVNNPLELGDHLIHEFQHNRLSFIEESGPLFSDDAAGNGFYSPWRDKPRGLYGVYHGVYVFLAVNRYWLAVYDDEQIDPVHRAYALDRVLRIPLQLALAAGNVQRNAQLTRFGSALFDQLATDLVSARDDATTARELPPDAPALVVREDGSYGPEASRVDGRHLTVCESIREHLLLHDTHHQCDGLLDAS